MAGAQSTPKEQVQGLVTRSESASSSPAEQEGESDSRLLGLSRRIDRVTAKLSHFRDRAPGLIRAARIIGFVLAIGVLIFVGYRASKGVDLNDLRWGPIAGALVGFIVYWLCLGQAWSVISGSPMNRQAVATWCRTQVLRYFSGGLLSNAARATTVQGRKRDKLAAVIGENLTMLAAAVTLGGLFRAVGEKLIYIPLVFAVLGPFVLLRLVRGKTTLTHAKVARATVWYLVAFAAFAGASVLAQAGVGPTTHDLRIAGAACLAWAVGILVVVAPSGLGAREAIYVGLLANALPEGLPAAGAITSRLIMIAAELLVLVAVAGPWWNRVKAKE